VQNYPKIKLKNNLWFFLIKLPFVLGFFLAGWRWGYYYYFFASSMSNYLDKFKRSFPYLYVLIDKKNPFYLILLHWKILWKNIDLNVTSWNLLWNVDGVYLSQLIVQNLWFLSRSPWGLLITRLLLNQGFLVVMLKSSLPKFYGSHYDLVDRCGISMLQMTTNMFCLS
jgi:hypothetical protein